MEKLIIRTFKPADLNQVLEIEQTCFKEPYSAAMFMFYHRSEPGSFVVAEQNGLIIGYIIISAKQQHIISIAVKSALQRKGLGSALIEKGIQTLRTNGIRKIGSETRVSNKASQAFFARHGFKKTATIPHYYSNAEDAFLLELEL